MRSRSRSGDHSADTDVNGPLLPRTTYVRENRNVDFTRGRKLFVRAADQDVYTVSNEEDCPDTERKHKTHLDKEEHNLQTALEMNQLRSKQIQDELRTVALLKEKAGGSRGTNKKKEDERSEQEQIEDQDLGTRPQPVKQLVEQSASVVGEGQDKNPDRISAEDMDKLERRIVATLEGSIQSAVSAALKLVPANTSGPSKAPE